MTPYKSWKMPLLKERNDKICRLWAEGTSVAILSERFGLFKSHIRRIVEERENGQEATVRLRPKADSIEAI